MSSAIQTIGGKQIIKLGSPLVVGIRVQGTIGYSPPDRPHETHIKPRPYLHYLADTLKHLHCDVSLLFNPIGICTRGQDHHTIKQFYQRHFPLPFRCVFDEGLPLTPTTDRSLRRIARNYSDYFRSVCQEVQANPSRVIFIDSEINYRYPTLQALIVEVFDPRKKRQERQSSGLLHPCRDLSFSSSQERRYEAYQSGIKNKISDIESKTAALQKESEQNREKSGEDYEAIRRMHFGQKDSSAMDPNRSVSSHPLPSLGEFERGKGVVGRRIDSKITNDASRVKEMLKSKTPLAMDSVDLNWVPSIHKKLYKEEERTNEGSRAQNNHSEANKNEKEGASASSSSFNAPAITSLAINKEDFTLVALAELIAELAASEVSVSDYLNREVLVEKINVPSHGVINYLPIENCDYINMLDWEQVRVEEKERNEANQMPEVREREEHKDLFK